jgi:quercetin dioxygenase-like cupin family protein
VIIKKLNNVPFIDFPGYDHVKKGIVIGPEDGSGEIVLRYFSIEPAGTSPHHSHNFPHLVKIECGKGTVTDAAGNDHQLQTGDFVYIDDNEAHHFNNTGSEPFDFICIVPKRGET